jgi:hypothetical protein
MRARAARYDRASGHIVLELSNGYLFGFPASTSPYLRGMTDDELSAVTVLPGGGGLHWDSGDVDLSVPGLLLVLMDKMHKRQHLSELARAGGRSTSEAKIAAARANGTKGGRPRKASVPTSRSTKSKSPKRRPKARA